MEKKHRVTGWARRGRRRVGLFFSRHSNDKNNMQGIMKHLLPFLFLVTFVLWAPAEPPCVTTSCSESVKTIADCPDDGCNAKNAKKHDHPIDPQLDKLKNIRSDNQQSDLRSIQAMKDLSKPSKNFTECGSRDELKQLGEGQKITVVAWALTARPGNPESCNCDLHSAADTDNHIVLVDPAVKNPTIKKDEIHSVTAEFTPRVRLDHPNFTRGVLNGKIRKANGKLLVRVTGLQMFDSGHFFPKDPKLIRATNWEIHPVLKMEFCPNGETCRADSDENWKDLDNE